MLHHEASPPFLYLSTFMLLSISPFSYIKLFHEVNHRIPSVAVRYRRAILSTLICLVYGYAVQHLIALVLTENGGTIVKIGWITQTVAHHSPVLRT